MTDPAVRQLGAVCGLDGVRVHVGTDYDSITFRGGGGLVRLSLEQAEAFAQLFIAACWQAGRQAEHMAAVDQAEDEPALD